MVEISFAFPEGQLEGDSQGVSAQLSEVNHSLPSLTGEFSLYKPAPQTEEDSPPAPAGLPSLYPSCTIPFPPSPLPPEGSTHSCSSKSLKWIISTITRVFSWAAEHRSCLR